MADSGHSLISKPGYPYIALVSSIGAGVWVWLGWYYSLPAWLMLGFLFYIFRDPKRMIPAIPLGVQSPTDGHVTSVESRSDPYLDRNACCITIEMNPFGSYVTRSPTEGKICQRWFELGKKQPKEDDKGFKGKKGSIGIWIQTDEQDDVVVRMERPSLLRNPRCYVQSGERVGQGQRCGFILFGVQVEVYVPTSSRINVQAGDRLIAGRDTLAKLVHRS